MSTDSNGGRKPLPWIIAWLDVIEDHPTVWAFGVATGAVMGFVMGLAW